MHINTAGLPIEQTFKRTRVQVIQETNGRQTPWDTSSLTGEFFFEAKAQLTPEELQEKQLWDSVKTSEDPVQLMLFLRSYPAGRYQEEARLQLTAMLEKELGTAPAASPDSGTKEAPKTEEITVATLTVQAPAPQTPSVSEDELIGAAQKQRIGG